MSCCQHVLPWHQKPANTTFFSSHNPSAPIETPSHCWVEVIIVERTLFLSWGRGSSFFSINIIFIWLGRFQCSCLLFFECSYCKRVLGIIRLFLFEFCEFNLIFCFECLEVMLLFSIHFPPLCCTHLQYCSLCTPQVFMARSIYSKVFSNGLCHFLFISWFAAVHVLASYLRISKMSSCC